MNTKKLAPIADANTNEAAKKIYHLLINEIDKENRNENLISELLHVLKLLPVSLPEMQVFY